MYQSGVPLPPNLPPLSSVGAAGQPVSAQHLATFGGGIINEELASLVDGKCDQLPQQQSLQLTNDVVHPSSSLN